jgi:hypothetical protein
MINASNDSGGALRRRRAFAVSAVHSGATAKIKDMMHTIGGRGG